MKKNYAVLPNESIIMAHPKLCRSLGRVEALLIQQIHYFGRCGKGMIHEHIPWIYYTIDQWATQLAVSASTIKRAFRKLRHLGLIKVEKLKRLINKSDQTNSYALDMDVLTQVSSAVELHVNNDLSTGSKKLSTGTPEARASKTPVSRTNAHGVKNDPTPPRGQNDPMVIQRTYKSSESNKSMDEGFTPVVKEEAEKGPVLASVMLGIWNDCVMEAKGTPKTNISKPLAKHLVAAFNRKFNKCVGEWQTYCDLIASSAYMMGPRFQLNLAWALRFSTIDRIGQGELGVATASGTSDVALRPVDDAIVRAHRHIDDVSESSVCKHTRRQILNVVGAVAYCTWFTEAVIHGEDGELIRFPSQFLEDTVRTRFGYLLEDTPIGETFNY